MLKGFDPEFRDFEHYILSITEQIWEGRGIDLIRRWYGANCIVRTPGGFSDDVEAVVASTNATLAEFPDRRLLGEDVIWAGDEDEGFLSSHRIISTMHHWGDGVFGKASQKPVVVRTVADCAAKDGQIYEEWLVRDQGAIANCIGSSPKEMAQAWVNADREAGRDVGFFTPAIDKPGPYHRDLSTEAPAVFYQSVQEALWNDSAISKVAEAYHPAISVGAPSGETAVGHAGVEGLLFDYLSSFPGAEFKTEHLIVRQDPGRPARVALRWSLTGTHTGRGRFGTPTGKPIYIMGINHAEVRDGMITAEWVLIDEIAVWKQILA